jgi:hypothetical protein
MGDDLEPLTTLYARFDAITRELAQRDRSTTWRGALSQRAGNRQLAGTTRRDTPPRGNGLHAMQDADSYHSRFTTLKAVVMHSLQRVCPIMPLEELERLVTRATVTEMEYEERAMASSAVHMLEGGEDSLPTPVSTPSEHHSGNGTR